MLRISLRLFMSNGFNHNFKKLIFLPSNGLEYLPYASIKNVTMSLTLLTLDKNASNTDFENIIQIIERYVELPTSIFDMFVIDIYFIWASLLSLEINDSDKYVFGGICKHCGEVNSISMNFSQHKTNVIDRYKPFKQLKVKINKDTIVVNLRKTKDNIDYTYLKLYSKEKDNITNIIHYIISQIDYIETWDRLTDKQLIFEYLQFLSYKDLVLLLELVSSYNHIYGIENELMYRCINCRKSNYTTVFDDFRFCVINPSGVNTNKIIGFYKDNIEFSQLSIMSIEDYMNIPYRDGEFFNQGLQGAKLLPRGF